MVLVLITSKWQVADILVSLIYIDCGGKSCHELEFSRGKYVQIEVFQSILLPICYLSCVKMTIGSNKQHKGKWRAGTCVTGRGKSLSKTQAVIHRMPQSEGTMVNMMQLLMLICHFMIFVRSLLGLSLPSIVRVAAMGRMTFHSGKIHTSDGADYHGRSCYHHRHRSLKPSTEMRSFYLGRSWTTGNSFGFDDFETCSTGATPSELTPSGQDESYHELIVCVVRTSQYGAAVDRSPFQHGFGCLVTEKKMRDE
jgi:hypothetical protein